MVRLIAVFLILAGCIYGSGSEFCNCPPSISVFINHIDYSNSFQQVTLDGGHSYSITGAVTDDAVHPTFHFALNATTHQDPDVDFDTSISGDPTVSISITQSFLGLFSFLQTTSSGTIFDLNGGGAFALGSPFIQTTSIDGLIVNQLNTGCTLASVLATGSPCPSLLSAAQTLTGQSDDPESLHILKMDIKFTLSDGDKYVLNGSANLSSVPEPATMVPLTAAFLLMAGFAWRQNRNRGIGH